MHFSVYLKHLPSSRKNPHKLASLPCQWHTSKAEENRTTLKMLLLAHGFLNEQSHKGCGKELSPVLTITVWMRYFKSIFSFLKFIFTSSLCTCKLLQVKFLEVRIRTLRTSAAGKWLSQLPIKKTRICKTIICVFMCIHVHHPQCNNRVIQKCELHLSTASSTKIYI